MLQPCYPVPDEHYLFAYILRRNPFRDNSLLLDCFHESAGRLSIVARFSKRQGNRIKGMLEPFRLLDLYWSGSGEVHTLRHAEENAVIHSREPP
ncbi:MAG: recombination protein O N-terminal domain-containing protein [Thiolinea sp.]